MPAQRTAATRFRQRQKFLLAQLGADDATWTRGRGRTLSQALIALPYYRRTNPVMARGARHVIREVLAER